MVIFKSLYNIKLRIPNNITIGSLSRYFSTKLEQSSKGTYSLAPFKDILECTDKNTENILRTGIEVYTNFITTEEETSLFDEVHNYLRRLRYEKSHWDDVGINFLINYIANSGMIYITNIIYYECIKLIN